MRRIRKQRRSNRTSGARRLIGSLLFAAALFAIWSWAPKLGVFGDEVAAETSAARERATERVNEMTNDLLDDISEKTGVDVTVPTSDLVTAAAVDGWALPLASIDALRAARPHHNYPAWDYGTPVGTELMAMTSGRITTALDDDGARCGGTVSITTDAGAQITHCHLSSVLVDRGDDVEAGDLLGLTGGQPGAPGAGNTSGPHLHLQIRLNGELLCPQAQLLAIGEDTPLRVEELPSRDCFYSTSNFGAVTSTTDKDDVFFRWDQILG